jgi:hypothetical protein
MKKFFATAFLALLVSPLLAQRSGSHSSGSHSSYSSGPRTVYVHGYTRKDGTYITPYSRSAPGMGSKSQTGSAWDYRGLDSGRSDLSEWAATHPPASATTGSSISPPATSGGSIRWSHPKSSAASSGTYRSTIPSDHRGRRSIGHSFSHRPISSQHPKSYCATCLRQAEGWIARSEAAKHRFMRQTGYPHGRSGYVIDHIIPLACGGADAPSNMQWQTVAEAKRKDAVERRGCR